jgi:hypothetical protein
MEQKLRVIILKPSKYGLDGYVDRFHRGFMPNATLALIRSLTPDMLEGRRIEVRCIDEYVQADMSYMKLLQRSDSPTLLALVGVQSNQIHRALDLAAYAKERGVEHCVLGGAHAMTCDTSAFQGRGVSIAASEAELVWEEILSDAIHDSMKPLYGRDTRWQSQSSDTVILPPSPDELKRHMTPMLGLHPARGCPFICNFCSVIKISGRKVRSSSVESVIKSLRLAREAGVKLILFTSDNFNKIPDASELLQAIVDEKLGMRFFLQCDTQISQQPELVALLKKAGCFQIFIGVESLDRKVLLGVRKSHNHPDRYKKIIDVCREYDVMVHFSSMLGFPEHTKKGIDEHVQGICDLDPDITSFFVVTPIPGTEQYAEYKKAGWLIEPNLDRYDTTYPTWKHPNMTTEEIYDSLFMAYGRFYSSRHLARYVRRHFEYNLQSIYFSMYPIFNRFVTWRRRHPMTGGVGKVKIDAMKDYIDLRRKKYGFELAPMPDCLELSKTDADLNKQAQMVVTT